MRATRTKSLANATRANLLAYSSTTSVPKLFQLVIGTKIVKLRIETPKYKEMSKYLAELDDRPFVEMDSQYDSWLFKFAETIMNTEPNESAPFLNPALDYKNPGMSAFKVFSNRGSFQVQVRKMPEISTLFQLDCFEFLENTETALRMVMLCDVSDAKSVSADVVFTKGVPVSIQERYKSVISTVFRDILIYLRPWDYSVYYKHCTVTPLPKHIFPIS